MGAELSGGAAMTNGSPKRRESPVKRINPSGDVVWKARYTDPEGHRRSAGTFKRKRDAQDAINAAYQAPVTPQIPDTVGAYLDTWIARYPRAKRTDKTNYGRIRQVLPVEVESRPLADWPLSDLRRRHALALVDHMLREQGRATTGATNILRSLSAMAEDAITDELCDVNPFKGVRVRGNDPRATKARKQPTVLSWEQMHAFAAAAGQYEPMIRMLADCGLRIGELLALARAAQDLKTGVFTVVGTAWEGEVMQDSREKRHDRDGPIAPGCLALLRAMPVRIDTPWLFPTKTGKLWLINNFYRDVWHPARAASGIACMPHDFRHSWVTNLAGAGLDEADLADVAGHGIAVQGNYRQALRRSFDAIRSEIG
jgi:integrase